MIFASEEFRYYTWYLKAISIVGRCSVGTHGTEQACLFFLIAIYIQYTSSLIKIAYNHHHGRCPPPPPSSSSLLLLF